MKNASTPVLSFCFVLFTFLSNAQSKKIPLNEPDYKKPKLFQNLPDTIAVDVNELNALLDLETGNSMNKNLSKGVPGYGFQLHGDVIAKSKGNNNNIGIRTITIKLSDYPGANFTFSKITKPDGTIGYAGRIISFKNGDLFELKNQKGQLELVKRNYYELVNE